MQQLKTTSIHYLIVLLAKRPCRLYLVFGQGCTKLPLRCHLAQALNWKLLGRICFQEYSGRQKNSAPCVCRTAAHISSLAVRGSPLCSWRPSAFLVMWSLPLQSSNSALSPSHALILPDFLFHHQLEEVLCFKGSGDQIKSTYIISQFRVAMPYNNRVVTVILHHSHGFQVLEQNIFGDHCRYPTTIFIKFGN